MSKFAGNFNAGPLVIFEGNEFIDVAYHDCRHFDVELPPHKTPDDPFAECPTWGLPFFVEDNHVVREGLLLALQSAMEETHEAALTACHGFGGVGKTQMARYYCEFVQEEAPGLYRFIGWVQGSDEESVKRNLIALGQGLGLVAYDCKPEVAFAQIKGFFERNSDWLLVFDDIQETAWLDDLLPHGVGHVLVTTRNEHWDRGESIPVDVMEPEEAIALLERISGREDPAFEAIAEQLGYLPLALVQAASFIRLHVDPDESAEVYKTLYHETVAQRALLDYEKFPLGQLHDPVTITWLMNFKELQARSPNAVRLLQAMRFLHHNNIPWSVLIRFIDEENACGDEARWLVQEALVDLSDYSLIQNDAEQQRLSMHVLIHTILAWQRWEAAELFLDASDHPNSAIWELLVTALMEDLDRRTRTLDAYHHRQQLLPHLTVLTTLGKSPDLGASGWGVYELLCAASGIYSDAEDFGANKELLKEAVILARFMYGEQDREYALRLGDLGVTLFRLGEFDLSARYQCEAKVIYENACETPDIYLAFMYSNLGNLYRLRDPHVAKTYYERGIEIHRAHCGDKPDLVANMLQNLGAVCRALAEFEKACSAYQEAYFILVEFFSEDHFSVANARVGLATSMLDLEQCQLAREMLEAALPIQVDFYGEQSERVVHTLMHLGQVFLRLEDFTHAGEYSHRAHDIYHQLFLPASDLGAHINAFLSRYYVAKQEYEEARSYAERALADIGSNSLSVGVAFFALSSAECGLRDFSSAKVHLQKAHEIYAAYYGDTHQQTQSISNELLRLERAVELMTLIDLIVAGRKAHFPNSWEMSTCEVLSIREILATRLGLFSQEELVELYQKLQNLLEPSELWRERIAYYEHSIALQQAQWRGSVLQHTAVIELHYKIGELLLKHQDDYSIAQVHFEKALALFTDDLELPHKKQCIENALHDAKRAQFIAPLSEEGKACYIAEEYAEALARYQIAMQHVNAMRTLDPAETRDGLLYNIGSCFLNLNESAQAIECLSQCYTWRLDQFGDEDPRTQKVKSKLDSLGAEPTKKSCIVS